MEMMRILPLTNYPLHNTKRICSVGSNTILISIQCNINRHLRIHSSKVHRRSNGGKWTYVVRCRRRRQDRCRTVIHHPVLTASRSSVCHVQTGFPCTCVSLTYIWAACLTITTSSQSITTATIHQDSSISISFLRSESAGVVRLAE